MSLKMFIYQGSLLENVARITPNGLLIFFPSYTLMEICVNHWNTIKEGRKESCLSRIREFKSIHMECKNKADFSRVN